MSAVSAKFPLRWQASLERRQALQIKACPSITTQGSYTPASTVIKPAGSYVPRPRVNKTPQQPCRNWQQRVQQRGGNSGCN